MALRLPLMDGGSARPPGSSIKKLPQPHIDPVGSKGCNWYLCDITGASPANARRICRCNRPRPDKSITSCNGVDTERGERWRRLSMRYYPIACCHHLSDDPLGLGGHNASRTIAGVCRLYCLAAVQRRQSRSPRRTRLRF